MKRNIFLWGFRLLLVSGILVGALALPTILAAGKPGASACEEAVQWVRQNRATLPRTYEEIVAYPAAYRRYILSELNASERSAVWRESLAAFAAQENLSVEQQKLLVEYNNIVTQDYSIRNTLEVGPKVLLPLSQWKERAGKMFTQEQMRALTSRIGPEGVAYTRSLEATKIHMLANLRSYVTAQADVDNCDCNTWNGCWAGPFVVCDDGISCLLSLGGAAAAGVTAMQYATCFRFITYS